MRTRPTPMAGEKVTDFLGALLAPAARLGGDGDDVVLIREVAPPRHVIALHSHPEPECFYVLDGTLEVFLDDGGAGWRTIGVGESCLAADGVRHALRNPGNEPVDFLIATNNRLLSFFQRGGREASEAQGFVEPGAEDVDRAGRVAREYGYWRAEPAESLEVTGVA